MKVLRCHVGHTTIFHRPLPSAVLLRKLTNFPRSTPDDHFPALGTGRRAHILTRLAPGALFPALGTGRSFSRACYRAHILPRLVPGAHFPALRTGCTFSRALHRLLVLSHFLPAGVNFCILFIEVLFVFICRFE